MNFECSLNTRKALPSSNGTLCPIRRALLPWGIIHSKVVKNFNNFPLLEAQVCKIFARSFGKGFRGSFTSIRSSRKNSICVARRALEWYFLRELNSRLDMLCFKPTQKLARRLHVELHLVPSEVAPPAFCWLANEFIFNRCRYLIVTHEATLFSAVLPAKGICDAGTFAHSAARAIGWLAKQSDAEGVYNRFFADELGAVSFAKIDSKPALGSMNDLTRIAKIMLEPGERAPLDVSCVLNSTPMSMLKETILPFEAFKRLAGFTLVKPK